MNNVSILVYYTVVVMYFFYTATFKTFILIIKFNGYAYFFIKKVTNTDLWQKYYFLFSAKHMTGHIKFL